MNDATDQFLDEVIGVANGLKILCHNSRLEDTTFAIQDDATGLLVLMKASQCEAKVLLTGELLTIEILPDAEKAPGFVPVTIHAAASAFPGSPLFGAPGKASGRIPWIIQTFAELYDRIQTNGTVSAFEHDGHLNGAIQAIPSPKDAEIANYVLDLAHGFNVVAEGVSTIYVAHPALGAPARILIIDENETVYAPPKEDHPDTRMRQAGERVRMMQKWAFKLPNSILVSRSPDGSFSIRQTSMTYAMTGNRDEARSRQMVAYAKLQPMDPRSA